MATNRRKPTMVVDFDGIIYDYDQHGWNGIDKIEGLPLEDAKESLDRLSKAYNIVVYSSRCQEPRGRKAVEEYLEQYQIPYKEVVLSPIPHYVFLSPKAKRFPRRWTKDLIQELEYMAPKEG